MSINKNDDSYIFSIKDNKYELIFHEEMVEMFEIEDPSHTGFVFDDKKQLINLINILTDIIEKEEENEA